MPEKKTIKRAQKAKKEGKSKSTQAGEFVREEIDHIREGKHGAKNAKQAIAIGLSKARQAGVESGRIKKKKVSKKKSKAATKRLKKSPASSASKKALSRQSKKAANKRGPVARKKSAKKAASTRKKTKSKK
jgi:hypothetical protein